MRWSASVGAFGRQDAVWVSALAVAAALGAWAKLAHISWLAAVAAIVAVVGALPRLVIAVRRARLEGRRERTESVRLLRVPVAPIGEIDPTVVGVDPAAQSVLPGGRIPQYLERGIDSTLREAIAAALDGRDSWLVVVSGVSKAGKSRALFQALCRCSPAKGPLRLVAPINAAALRALLTPGQGPRLGSAPAVLWLDDLEPFVDQGMTWQTLSEWRCGGRGRIVAATYGGKGGELVAGSKTGGLATTAADVLAHAREIPLQPTTARELDSLRATLSDSEFEAVAQHGLAAYLVAGPALQRKLTTARHAAGEPPCPEGVAVVRAAIDWARCGRTDPIDHDVLAQLWPAYLLVQSPTAANSFDIALDWALPQSP